MTSQRFTLYTSALLLFNERERLHVRTCCAGERVSPQRQILVWLATTWHAYGILEGHIVVFRQHLLIVFGVVRQRSNGMQLGQDTQSFPKDPDQDSFLGSKQ